MKSHESVANPCRRVRRLKLRYRVGLLALACLSAAIPANAAAQAFGGAVLVADGQILVGEAAHQREPGTVRAYAYDGEWVQVATLQAPEASTRDGFGSALARSGDFLFVGANRTGGDRVYVYRLAHIGSGDARPFQTLGDPDLAGLGRSLVASGGEMVAAATTAENERVLATFRLDADGQWMSSGTLALPQGAGGAAGVSWLDLEGDLLAVANQSRSAVHVFEREAGGTGWALAAELTHPDSEAARFMMFPTAVAVSGDEVVVGQLSLGQLLRDAPSQPEVVHRFRKVDGAWTAVGTLSPEEEEGDAGQGVTGYGTALAGDGTALLVGASGQLFSYNRQNGHWSQSGAPNPSAAPALGETKSSPANPPLAFGGDIAALANPAADFGLGAVTVLTNQSGEWVRSAVLRVDHAALPAITGGEVACEEGEAAGYDCDHVDLLSFIPREELGAARGSRLNDVWGWTDPETGREYALVCRMDGTGFVDVTDALNPRYLGNLPRTEGSPSSTWRDAKVYRNHAFIVADGAGEHGMQVFDLTRLRDVTEPREFEATTLYTGVASSHNVAINEETGFAYLVGSSDGGETCGGGSHIVDINDPVNPVFAGCFAHPNTGRRNTGNSHDTQCVIYHGPDEDYRGREICVNSNETALSVADVTDKDNPVAIAAATYPSVAYAHQGWFTEDHRHFYSNDELDEVSGLVEATRTLIWDLTDLDDPLLASEYTSPTKATDHNLYVHGDRLYMSNNRAGLRVLDISDPENPVEIGHFDTTPWSADESGFDGTWSVYPYFASGTVLLSSRREGLFLVKPQARRLIP